MKETLITQSPSHEGSNLDISVSIFMSLPLQIQYKCKTNQTDRQWKVADDLIVDQMTAQCLQPTV